MKKLKIGLFGFGVVGEGIWQVLSKKQGLDAEIVKICVKSSEKSRNAPPQLFTTEKELLLNDPTINVIVELIDDSEAAFEIVSTALKNGKSVVSANKKMIAENHKELIRLQQEYQSPLLYEASVCGSIPILRNLEEYFDNDFLSYITGIVNGSTNYILTRMADSQSSFEESLKEAQQSGFAESNPTLDIEGIDAAFKLSIICLHAFGKLVNPASILRKGITSIRPHDLKYANEKGLKLKLISSVINDDQLLPLIFPTFLNQESTLGSVDNEFNGVLIGSSLADEQFLYGKGAGRFPTSSAVLSDISALKYDYKYELKKGHGETIPLAKGSRKFYMSWRKGDAIDTSLFEQIEEHYINQEVEFVVGEIQLEKLEHTDFWKRDDVSLIAFE